MLVSIVTSIAAYATYAKVVAGVTAGFAADRAWFAKEIKTGKAVWAHMSANTEAELIKAEADLAKVGIGVRDNVAKVETEVKKVETTVETDVKKI